MFFEYSAVKLQTVKIVNKAFMPEVSLSKVKLFVNIDRYIRSIVLIDVLYIP